MTFNKKIDRLESGTAIPKSPNDETIWVDTNNNSIKRYNETNDSWVSVGGAANTGDITFDGIQIIGDGTMELVPDSSLNSDQYLIIDPTAPNHVHIRAGGAIDASTADIIIGGENTNLLVSDTGDYVDVRTTFGSGSASYTNLWRFNSDGYLTGPAMGGLFVSGLLNGDNDLWLGASNDSVVLSPGSGSAFVGDTSNPNNQIATLGDISGATGTFATSDSKLVTVTNGIITTINSLT
jgi:hypothetical protein